MLVVESLVQLLNPLSMLSDVIEGENEKSQVNYQILWHFLSMGKKLVFSFKHGLDPWVLKKVGFFAWKAV